MAPSLEVNEFETVHVRNKPSFEDQILQLLTGPPQIIKLNDPYHVVEYLRRQFEKKRDKSTVSTLNSIPKITFDLSTRRFGSFGGRYAPELQMEALSSLATQFGNAISDIRFWKDFVGCSFVKPSPLQLATNLTQYAGGANIWLKREDLNEWGSHKVRNIVGQILLAVRLGKTEIIMDCAYAGHAIVCATICKKLGLKCTIFMGSKDARTQKPEVKSMEQLGATVVSCDNGLGCYTIRAAIDDAHRYAVSRFEVAHYIPSGPIGPHPLPLIHRAFQSLLGEETKNQCVNLMSKLPDAVIVPVGMGSGAVGMFAPFINNPSVQLLGVQPAGSPLTSGSVGVLYGACTYLLQDDHGQVLDCSSYAEDLSCPTVGPELAHWKDIERVRYVETHNENAIDHMVLFHDLEGFLPAFATGYSIDKTIQLAKDLGPGKDVILLVSGRLDRSLELEF